MDPLRILLVVLGIGLVIFVHELGHFLFARLFKVRVEVFSLGFGPRLAGIRRGHTLYQIAVFPIGGYVRMAGEERRAGGLPPRPDELPAKSVGARFLIYSGGVLMNVVFALVLFPVVFAAGVRFTPPVVGEVMPGGAAWEEGVEEGSTVLAVDGEEPIDFPHVLTSVALGDPERVELTVRRPDGEVRTLRLRPRRDERIGIATIGIGPAVERDEAGRPILDVPPDSPAWEAGLRPGDRLVDVRSDVPGLVPLEALSHELSRGGPVEVSVLRPGEEEPRAARIEPVPGPERAPPRVGIAPAHRRVAGVRGELARERFGVRAGDRLLSAARTPVVRAGDLRRALAAAAPGEIVLEVLRDGRPRTLGGSLDSAEEALALADGIAVAPDVESTAVAVNPGEPAAAAGLRDGDRVLAVDGVPVGAWEPLRELVAAAGKRGESVRFRVERGAGGEARPERLEIDVRPEAQPIPTYGLALRQAQYVYRTGNVAAAIGAGARSSWRFAQDCWLTLERMLRRQVSPSSLGGPIAIGAISYSFAEAGWSKLLFFLCMLSINLAFLNVLPIPLLDGGHLFFLLVEKLKGSPVSDRVLGYSQLVGLVLILSLMVYVTYQDVVRWILGAA